MHPQLCGNAELFNDLFLATGIIGSVADVVHLGRWVVGWLVDAYIHTSYIWADEMLVDAWRVCVCIQD